MRKFQDKNRPWRDIARDLRLALQQCNETPMQIQRATGVKHHAIRRMRSGMLENRTKNAEVICRKFKIPLFDTEKVRINGETDITYAIQSVWDGTPTHAELIIRLIESTRNYQILNKN